MHTSNSVLSILPFLSVSALANIESQSSSNEFKAEHLMARKKTITRITAITVAQVKNVVKSGTSMHFVVEIDILKALSCLWITLSWVRHF